MKQLKVFFICEGPAGLSLAERDRLISYADVCAVHSEPLPGKGEQFESIYGVYYIVEKLHPSGKLVLAEFQPAPGWRSYQ